MIRRRVAVVVLAACTLGLWVWAQTGGVEALEGAIQALLGEKQTGQVFLNFAAPEGKTVETSAPQVLGAGEELPGPGRDLMAAIEDSLPEKGLTVTHGFLLPPKEEGPVSNQFLVEPED